MPPWAKGKAPARSSSGGGGGPMATNTRAEVERIRQSYEDVCRERDLLKSHVSSMERLVQQQVREGILGKSALPPKRPSSAPHGGRGGIGSGGPSARPGSASGGGGLPRRKDSVLTPRGKLKKEDEDELLRRVYGKCWRPNRDARGSGVEQLKRRLETNEKAARNTEMEKAMRGPRRSKDEIERAMEEMFKRDTSRRKKLIDDLKAKQLAQVPVHAKSKAVGMERAVRFTRLAMPNPHVRTAKKVPVPPGGIKRTGWFAGDGKAGTRSWSEGRLGSQFAGGGAVH